MKSLTPIGVARILQRCIKAHYKPENQVFRVNLLIDEFENLVLAREDEIRYDKCDVKRAELDIDFLQRIVNELSENFKAGINE